MENIETFINLALRRYEKLYTDVWHIYNLILIYCQLVDLTANLFSLTFQN